MNMSDIVRLRGYEYDIKNYQRCLIVQLLKLLRRKKGVYELVL